MNDGELSRVSETFVVKYLHLEEALCSDRGIKLTNTDSLIAEIVIERMTSANVPVF